MTALQGPDAVTGFFQRVLQILRSLREARLVEWREEALPAAAISGVGESDVWESARSLCQHAVKALVAAEETSRGGGLESPRRNDHGGAGRSREGRAPPCLPGVVGVKEEESVKREARVKEEEGRGASPVFSPVCPGLLAGVEMDTDGDVLMAPSLSALMAGAAAMSGGGGGVSRTVKMEEGVVEGPPFSPACQQSGGGGGGGSGSLLGAGAAGDSPGVVAFSGDGKARDPQGRWVVWFDPLGAPPPSAAAAAAAAAPQNTRLWWPGVVVNPERAEELELKGIEEVIAQRPEGEVHLEINDLLTLTGLRRACTTCTVISLRGWLRGMSDDDASRLASVLRTGMVPNLLKLDLHWNSITDRGATAIALALQSGKVNRLSKLDLSNGKIGLCGAKRLAEALKSGSVPELSALNLADNRIDAEGCVEIAKALRSGKLPLLSKLDLSNTYVGFFNGAIVSAFKEALQSGQIPRLSELKLSGIFIQRSSVADSLKAVAPRGCSIIT
uniref:Uncharacterized protein n=1 Tax=Chromera velia CCMP2878 TaxID=1169474 RepID=A0A0G4GFU8_9ALVE|eukprot:Cvel_21620.t1-p1 / transcript=Cvel_21620.t1 / gene=Cvel_21620 / organism=Chromera_velia_CCMP2878 / gene_product=hypothetical protein / transcript_product=hypothetical protein / location=Cvel_scaffold2043:11644-13747(+) / protein_length=500 / sequence_SO=supercontig / SO=protein_coding / is_pseudo=false